MKVALFADDVVSAFTFLLICSDLVVMVVEWPFVRSNGRFPIRKAGTLRRPVATELCGADVAVVGCGVAFSI